MRTSLLFLVVCLSVVFALNEEEQFASWMAEYKKVYASDEYHVRFANFKATLAKIEKLNAEDGAVFGLNSFADLSEQEFRESYLMKKPVEYVESSPATPFMAAPGAPTTFDWRTRNVVTPVKNQASCGSCWAFSATEAIESAWIIAGKATTAIDLSPQQIVDCDHTNSGCGGGWPDKAMTYVHNAGGLEGIAHYPYTAKDGKCIFQAQYVEAKVAAYETATKAKDETTLQANLLAWGPLSICVDATTWQTYRSGVISSKQCCPGSCSLDHCVQLVGYNTTASPAHWIVRNSWGVGWGVSGYIYLEMGGNTCALTNHATWPQV